VTIAYVLLDCRVESRDIELKSSGTSGIMSGRSSSTSSASVSSPLSPLPLSLPVSKACFTLSPLADPDLVLTLVIPGHKTYGGSAALNGVDGEESTAVSSGATSAADTKQSRSLGSRISHLFGSAANTVTNTAANSIGIRNQLELNRPKLRLDRRNTDPIHGGLAMNQRWVLNKRDQCIYSCVEEHEGDGLTYKLGLTRNQLIEVNNVGSVSGGVDESPGGQLKEGGGKGITSSHLGVPGAARGSNASEPASITRRSSNSSSGVNATGITTPGPPTPTSSSSSTDSSTILVTTSSTGSVLAVPLRWEIGAVMKAENIRESIEVGSKYVIIADLESGSGVTSSASTAASGGGSCANRPSASRHASLAMPSSSGGGNGSSTSSIDSSRLLMVKHKCCGVTDCELEKIEVGSSVGFKMSSAVSNSSSNSVGSKDAELSISSSPGSDLLNGDSSSSLIPSTGCGVNLKQIWRMESEFSCWISSLSRTLSNDYHLAAMETKMDKERKHLRSIARQPRRQALKLSTEYELKPMWFHEGGKGSAPVGIWRPQPSRASNFAFFGDFCLSHTDSPTSNDMDAMVAYHEGHAASSLHPAFVRPIDFELVYTNKHSYRSKKSSKAATRPSGILCVWNPLPPPDVDAVALGHVVSVATSSGKEMESKPSTDCGVVLVRREYVKLTGQPFTESFWLDAGSGANPLSPESSSTGGGSAVGLWRTSFSHTFVANACTREPPSGSYYKILNDEDAAEPLQYLRDMNTCKTSWELIWDDRGTLSTQDTSIWRPTLKVGEGCVRFGDLVVRGYDQPSSAAIVAKDHPAFIHPIRMDRVSKIIRGGGTKKVYVWRPVPPSDEYVSLGFLVTPSKHVPPSRDVVRCVHRSILHTSGVLKQMWMESGSGILNIGHTIASLTDKVFRFGSSSSSSSNDIISMLWRNRTMNTFIAIINSHSRPVEWVGGSRSSSTGVGVYRLPPSDMELAESVRTLEYHARWVLDSIEVCLSTIVESLLKSNYNRMILSPNQIAALFMAVEGVYQYMRARAPATSRPSSASRKSSAPALSSSSSASSSSEFTLSPSFLNYLDEFESKNLKSIYATFKRALYTQICSELSDHEATLEVLDDLWVLVTRMPPVHKDDDSVDEWKPSVRSRWPASKTKGLVSMLFEEIGNEIFERFLESFPPRITAGVAGMQDGDDEAEESMSAPSTGSGSEKAALSAADLQMAGFTPLPTSNSASSRSTSVESREGAAGRISKSDSVSSSVSATLTKLRRFTEELDTIIGITSSITIRKLYLEFYQRYLIHVLEREFPVDGRVARCAGARNKKIGTGPLLQIVGWIGEYIELVEFDLLEGDHVESRTVLSSMENLVDSLMDCHDEQAKERMISWVTNIVQAEEKTQPELREGFSGDHGESKSRNQVYYYTNGAQDLFSNLNLLFEAESSNLRGRPLARLALMYVHVLSYYHQVQMSFFKVLRAKEDGTTHETVRGKTSDVSSIHHAGSLEKPYAYILAQVNNSRLYAVNVDEFADGVLGRVGDDPAASEDADLMNGLEDAFATCSEEYEIDWTIGCVDILLRHVKDKVDKPMAQLFTSTWFKNESDEDDGSFLQAHVLDELDELIGKFVPNIEPNLGATHLLRESTKDIIRSYIRFFLAQCQVLHSLASKVSGGLSAGLQRLVKKMKDDRMSMLEYAQALHKWNVLDSVTSQLSLVDCLLSFLEAESDFIRLPVTEVEQSFKSDPEFRPSLVLAALLHLRSDIPSDDRKRFLAPYAAELKAIEDARRKAAAAVTSMEQRSAAQKLANMLGASKSNIVVPSPSSSSAILANEAYGLEIKLLRGLDLAVKDISTSDPYVNILLLNRSGERLDKKRSKVISKTLNPVWNQSFGGYKASLVHNFDRIRFEVFDKDFLSKDFMGAAELSLNEIRNRQLLARSTSVSNNAQQIQTDYTQEPLFFHLQLQPRPGVKNEGSNLVSGYLDVEVKYFRLHPTGLTPTPIATPTAMGATPTPSPMGSKLAPPMFDSAAKGRSASASAASITSAPPPSDDMDWDDGVDDAGQMGSKRPASASLSSSPPPSASPPSAISIPLPITTRTPSGSMSGRSTTSSTAVLSALESGDAPSSLWDGIGKKFSLKKIRMRRGSDNEKKKATESGSAPRSRAGSNSNAEPEPNRSKVTGAGAATSKSTHHRRTSTRVQGGQSEKAGSHAHNGKRKELQKTDKKDSFNVFKVF